MKEPSIQLKLYITGRTARSQTAIHNISELCRNQLGGSVQFEIIDILDDPEVAEKEKILATPTLIKTLPPPLRRLIGDLSEHEKVLRYLEILSNSPTEDQV